MKALKESNHGVEKEEKCCKKQDVITNYCRSDKETKIR